MYIFEVWQSLLELKKEAETNCLGFSFIMHTSRNGNLCFAYREGAENLACKILM